MLTWVVLDETEETGEPGKNTWDRLKLSQHAMIEEVGSVIDELYASLTSYRTIDNTTTNYSTNFTLAELLLEDPLPEKLETLLAYEWIECRSSSKRLPRNWPLYRQKNKLSMVMFNWNCSAVVVGASRFTSHGPRIPDLVLYSRTLLRLETSKCVLCSYPVV